MNIIDFPPEILYHIIVPTCLLEAVKVCKQFNIYYKHLINLDPRRDVIANECKLLKDIVRREDKYLFNLSIRNTGSDCNKFTSNILQRTINLDIIKKIVESSSFTKEFKNKLNISEILYSCVYLDNLEKLKYILSKWNDVNIEQLFINCFNWIWKSKSEVIDNTVATYLFNIVITVDIFERVIERYGTNSYIIEGLIKISNIDKIQPYYSTLYLQCMNKRRYTTCKLLVSDYGVDPCINIVDNITRLCSLIKDEYCSSPKLMLDFLWNYPQVRKQISNYPCLKEQVNKSLLMKTI